MLPSQPRSSEGTPVRNRTLEPFGKSPSQNPMAKPSSNRRLFQADGYTFIRWIEHEEVERMLEAEEIETCFDLRTDRALGFKLLGPSDMRVDGASSRTSLIPFSRPTRTDEHFHYAIPHAGDCRSICPKRFGLRTKRVTAPGTNLIFTTRTLKVSARKIDFTAAAYMTPARVLSNSNVGLFSLDSHMAQA
jgi:hypothetical protein